MVLNFTPRTYNEYFLPVDQEGIYEEIFNSDDKRYGGSGVTNEASELVSRPNPELKLGKAAENICPWAIRFRVPPLGSSVLRLKKKRFEDD